MQEVSKFLVIVSTKLGSMLDVFSRLQEGLVTKLLLETKLLREGLEKEVAMVFKEVDLVRQLSVETVQPLDRTMVEEVLLIVEWAVAVALLIVAIEDEILLGVS